MVIKYPVLTGEIARRGMIRSRMAKAIGVSPRSFYNKMTGKAHFTWEEVCTIQSQFFPDITKEELFRVG